MSLKVGHVSSNTRSNLKKNKVCLLIFLRPHFQPNTYETWSECLSHRNLEGVWKWVIMGQNYM